MSGKEKHNPIIKYLEAQKFIDYCKANRVNASFNVLETYEKYGILKPIYRLIVPEEYVKAKYEYNHFDYQKELQELVQEVKTKYGHDKRNHYVPKIKFNCPFKWKPIETLINAMSRYSIMVPITQKDGSRDISHLENIIENGHPLERKYPKNNSFLKVPDKNDFRPWKEYEVVVEIKDGYPVKENTAEEYYAPWQIFVVDELNYRHTIEKNYLTKEVKGWSVIKENIHKSRILEFSDLFQTVSNFRMLKSIIWIIETDDVKGNVIEGKRYKTLEERTKKIAKKEYKCHEDEWLKFIRKLVELYNHYTELEKNKLSQELKRFLGDTATMVIMARDIDFKTLCDEYGEGNKSWGIKIIDDIRVYYKGLEKIFSIEENQLREHAHSIFPSYIKQINESLPADSKLPDNFNEQLVDIIKKGDILLLTHLHEIEELWFNHKLHWVGTIWAHLRSLAIGMEDIGKEWFDERTLEGVFKKAFGENYKNLKEKYDSKLPKAKDGKNSITWATTPDEFIKKLNCILKNKDLSNNISNSPLCKYHLVVTRLTRNFIAHHTEIEDIRWSLFIEIYRCLILTLISLAQKKPKLDFQITVKHKD